MLLVALDRLVKVPQRLMCIPEGAVDKHSFARLRCSYCGCHHLGIALHRNHAPPVTRVLKAFQLCQKSSLDVGEGIASLLADALAVVGQESCEARQGPGVDNGLHLRFLTRDNVAHRPQRGVLDLGRLVHEQLHEAGTHARVDDRLDLVVGSVREVRQRPARVGENLLVIRVDERRKGGERGLDEIKGRLGLATAQVGQRPDSVAQHRDPRRVGVQQVQERHQHTVAQHLVTHLDRVASNVSHRQHGLLAHVVARRVEQQRHLGHDARFHADCNVL